MTPSRWRLALWLGALAVVLWTVWQSRAALLPFAVGALAAYALSPLVDRLASLRVLAGRSETTRRGVAVAVIYVALALAGFWAVSVVVPLATRQIVEFVDTLPETVAAAQTEGSRWLERYRERVPVEVQLNLEGYLDDASAAAAAAAAAMARRSIATVTSTIGFIFGFAVTPFFVFYAMRDRSRAAATLLAATPPALQADVRNVLQIGDRMLARFLQGQLVLGLIVGLAAGIGLTLLDVQLSLGLGVIAGLTELIPIVGPFLGAIPGLLIVLATDPEKVVWVALLYFGIQISENYLLVPRIQGGAVQIHPAMVLVLLVVFGAVLGFWGLVIAVPLTAILRELFWYFDARLRGLPAVEAFATTRVAYGAARAAQAPLVDAAPADEAQPP
jgi:predicted PurR-regulated permease PerM